MSRPSSPWYLDQSSFTAIPTHETNDVSVSFYAHPLGIRQWADGCSVKLSCRARRRVCRWLAGVSLHRSGMWGNGAWEKSDPRNTKHANPGGTSTRIQTARCHRQERCGSVHSVTETSGWPVRHESSHTQSQWCLVPLGSLQLALASSLGSTRILHSRTAMPLPTQVSMNKYGTNSGRNTCRQLQNPLSCAISQLHTPSPCTCSILEVSTLASGTIKSLLASPTGLLISTSGQLQ